MNTSEDTFNMTKFIESLDDDDYTDDDYDESEDADSETGTTALQHKKCPELYFFEVNFYRYVAVAAVLLIIAFTLLQQWRTKGRGGLFNKIAIVKPVDLINQRRVRFPYVAAFNMAAFALHELIEDWAKVLDRKGGKIDVPGVTNLVKLLVCFLVAIMFYPVFAAISSDHVIGYMLGTLYVWGLTVCYMVAQVPCRVSYKVAYEIAQLFPCLPWMIFLCIWFPYKIFRDIQVKMNYGSEEKHKKKIIFHREYVRHLMNPNCDSPVQRVESYGRQGSILQRITKFIFKRIYAPIPGFRFPVSMLAATSVSVTLMWMIAIELLEQYANVLAFINKHASKLLTSENPYLQMLLFRLYKKMTKIEQLRRAQMAVTAFTVCLYFSFAIALLLLVLAMLLTLRNYRNHMIQVYKGNVIDLPPVPNSPRMVVVASTKYVGYQFAYALWGCGVQAVILGLGSLVIALIILIVFIYEQYWVLEWALKQYGPPLAVLFLLLWIQQLMVHFLFLQKNDRGKRVLALQRLLCFFNFQYFMVFGNAAVGLISCLKRIIKSTLIGAFTLQRLDMSVFPRTFERKDPGFKAYVCLLAVENTQTNPKLLTFVELLWESLGVSEIPRIYVPTSRTINSTIKDDAVLLKPMLDSDPEKGGPLITYRPVDSPVMAENNPSLKGEYNNRLRRKKLIRNRWQVLLTLYNNPLLRHYRKKQTTANAGHAFEVADNIVRKAIRGLLMKKPAV